MDSPPTWLPNPMIDKEGVTEPLCSDTNRSKLPSATQTGGGSDLDQFDVRV